jgi:serralysin
MQDGLLNDTLTGLGGNDTLISSSGDDILIGGEGDDIYQIAKTENDRITTIVEIAGQGLDVIETDLASFTLMDNVEYLRGTSVDTDFAQILNGNSAANFIEGGAGQDTLVGMGGDDTYIIVSGSTDTIVEGFNAGNDKVKTDQSYTLGTNIEALVGQADQLVLVGNAANNSITVDGNIGSILRGLDGNDILVAGGSLLRVVGGNGDDTLKLSTADIDGDHSFAYGGIGNDTIMIRDTVGAVAFGNSGNDRFYLSGFFSSVELTGGSGNDTYYVRGSGDYKVVESANGGTDRIVTNEAELSIKSVANIENLTGTSTAGQALTGNLGGNVLIASSGNDSLTGGGARDVLTGGGGSDRFIFNRFSERGDTILDFDAKDFIVLKGTQFGGVEEGVLNAKNFVVGTVALDSNDHFIYRKFDGTLWYDKDGNGASAQRFIADLENDFQLRNVDILFF